MIFDYGYSPYFFRKLRLMRRSKFNVDYDTNKRTYDGIVFDSVTEMKYYRDVVCPMVESGDIVSCKLQVPYELQPKFVHDNKTVRAIVYVADFVITYKDGSIQVIDIKGCPDSVAKLKRKLFWFNYPEIDYRWIKYVKKYGGWIEYEEYEKIKRDEKRGKTYEL